MEKGQIKLGLIGLVFIMIGIFWFVGLNFVLASATEAIVTFIAAGIIFIFFGICLIASAVAPDSVGKLIDAFKASDDPEKKKKRDMIMYAIACILLIIVVIVIVVVA